MSMRPMSTSVSTPLAPADRHSATPIVDRGSGPPVVLIPGIHGRWEYFSRTVDALSQVARVITFSLRDTLTLQPDVPLQDARSLQDAAPLPDTTSLEHTTQGNGDRLADLDTYVDQVERALTERAVSRAIVCGISFGGLIALRFAARQPGRVTALVLVSTPGPGFRPSPAHERYMQRPGLFAPLFFAGAPRRLLDEIRAALPGRADRWRFHWQQLQTLVRAPLSPSAMAVRARLIASARPVADCRTITAPTLVVCGEPSLDHIVPVESSRQYAELIVGARLVTLERTGHLGCVTRPQAFAAAVHEFVSELELWDAA